MYHLGRAARTLLRAPAFTLLAGGTLALGIGAVTGMFTVVDQVLLEPLPVEDQGELVVVWGDHRVRRFPHYPLSWAAFEAVRGSGVFSAVAAHGSWGTADRIAEDAGGETTLAVAQVLGDFFGVLGVTPAAGRTLRPGDDVPGAERVVVISHGLWQRRYGGQRDVVGRSLGMGGVPFTIVGVLPPDFDYPRGAEVWTPERPFHAGWADSVPHLELDAVARLAPGATAERAKATLDRVFATDPSLRGYEEAVAVVRPFPEVVLGELRPTLLVLLAGAILVLGVACFNVANLVLVRAGRREADVAVRRALGAGRWRLGRDALLESTLLGAVGLVGGGVVAWLAVRLVLPLAPEGLPRLHRVGPPDLAALLVAAALTAGVVLVIALVPVVRSERSDPAGVLRGGGRSEGRRVRGRRRLLVVGQTALAVWVTASGALVLRSLLRLRALDAGFATADVVVVELDVPYPRFDTPEDLPARFARAAELLEARPGVEAATAALSGPLGGGGAWDVLVYEEGQSPEAALAENPFLHVEVVLPDYFRDLDLPVVRGRAPGPTDRPGTEPVVVVNEAAAAALWPGGEALGRRVRVPYPGSEETWWTVVGVAADSRYRELTEQRPALYLPLLQMSGIPPGHLLVRTAGPSVDLLPMVRDAFRAVDPDIRPKGGVSLERVLQGPLARPRFATLMLGLFAGVILVLAAVGVYGVMAALVRSRTREVGVRMACGAAPRDVGRMVVGQALALAAVGAAVGAGGTLLSGRLLEGLLFQVAATDPLSLGAAVLVVLVASALACLAPALRASGVEPAAALRSE